MTIMKRMKVGHLDKADSMREMAEKMESKSEPKKYKKGGACQKYAVGGVAKIRLGQYKKQKGNAR